MTHLDSEQTNPWASRPQEPTAIDRDADSAFRDDATVVGYDAMILPTSTPPPTQVEPTRPPPMQDDLASLKSIFPDFDDAVILSVLESTDGDHDRALDVLLGMNDPSFVPPDPPQPVPVPARDAGQQYPAPSTEQRRSQEALDEEFARRLALEEQQNAAQTAQWHHPTAAEGRVGYQPYQGRRNGWDAPQGQGQGQGRDTMTEVQEGFSRIAESGKKTFTSIVSKVRAKMQDMDQGQGWSWYQNPSNQPPQPGPAASSSYAQAPQGYAQPHQPQDPQRQQSHTSAFVTPPRSGVTRPDPGTVPVPAQHQPSYYDPNTRGYDLYGDDDDEPIQIDIPAPLTGATTTTTTQPHVPTDVSPQESNSASSYSFGLRSTSPGRLESRVFAGGAGTTTTATTATTTAPQPAAPDAASPLSSEATLPPSYASPRSTTPNAGSGSPARSQSPAAAGGKVDFSKLGLLPKRPISLVRPQSPAAAGASRAQSQSTDSSEEPEFVENPFEDPR